MALLKENPPLTTEQVGRFSALQTRSAILLEWGLLLRFLTCAGALILFFYIIFINKHSQHNGKYKQRASNSSLQAKFKRLTTLHLLPAMVSRYQLACSFTRQEFYK